jgi:membrane protein
MPTYASALAYQGLFALFPFVIFVGLLLVVLQVDGFFDRLIEQARSSLPEEALAPVAERLLRQGQEVAESNLVPFGIVFFAVWSASGVAWTLLEALNVVHQVEETRPLWKRFAISIVFAAAIGVMVILGAGLLLIGPQLAEWSPGG